MVSHCTCIGTTELKAAGVAIEGSTQEHLQFLLPGILGMMTLLGTKGVGIVGAFAPLALLAYRRRS